MFGVTSSPKIAQVIQLSVTLYSDWPCPTVSSQIATTHAALLDCTSTSLLSGACFSHRLRTPLFYLGHETEKFLLPYLKLDIQGSDGGTDQKKVRMISSPSSSDSEDDKPLKPAPARPVILGKECLCSIITKAMLPIICDLSFQAFLECICLDYLFAILPSKRSLNLLPYCHCPRFEDFFVASDTRYQSHLSLDYLFAIFL